MPDWSYRTLFRPVLFALPSQWTRNLVLQNLGRLSRVPLGPQLIDFLGHMHADPRLTSLTNGLGWPGPIGLGPHLDPDLLATGALSRFGFGFVDLGWVKNDGQGQEGNRLQGLHLDTRARAIEWKGRDRCVLVTEGVQQAELCQLPVVLRTDSAVVSDWWAFVERMQQVHGVLAVPAWAADEAAQFCKSLHERDYRLKIFVWLAAQDAALVPVAEVDGWLIDATQREGADNRLGVDCVASAQLAVEQLRKRVGDSPTIIVSAGLENAQQATELRAAGADLVEVDTGLIFSGPGLPKAINEALLSQLADPPPESRPATQMSWFWLFLMGVGLTVGGLMALTIAATRVVLPYDENFLQMNVEQLAAINHHLLAFLAHDRISLAGVMISLGVLYCGLSWFGVRNGQHWAWAAVIYSAFIGFLSFFLFFGFGYFDPFHAFVTAIQFQFLVQGVRGHLGAVRRDFVHWKESSAWRFSQWGQLLLVIQAAGIIGAGCVLVYFGCTHVFVQEDLEFMGTTREALAAASPQLIPFVAHDRATLGGMLLAEGSAVLMTVLWGIKRGADWLWDLLLFSGSLAFFCAIVVHFAVHYTDFWHLLPAIGGWIWLVVALLLCRGFMKDHRA
jgi:dihydroorotate dehydrogenase